MAIVDVSEDPVVWSNEEMLAGVDDDRTPRRSHSRIDDGHVNRSCGKRVVSGEQRKRARRHILCWNLVSDVRYHYLRVN